MKYNNFKLILILVLSIFVVLPILSLAEFLPSTAQNKDIAKIMPQGRFLYPQQGTVLKGEVRIEFEVENASLVSFYLRKPEALFEIYLGQGTLKNKNTWQYLWNTNFTHNGEYFLFPKIVNEYGEYVGQTITIKVENEVPKEEEKIEKIADEVEKTQTEIETQEKAIEADKEKIIKEIEEKVEEFLKKTPAIVEEKKREEIKSEIERMKKEFSETVKKNIEEALKMPRPEEERKKIKERIEKSIEKITKPIIDASKEEKKKEFQELEKKIKEEVGVVLEKEVKETAEKIVQIQEKKEKISAQDSDSDGLPDSEEIRLKTNPLNPDSDNDGFLDGSEIKLGFNPLRPSPADKIKYQDPREVKLKISETLKIEKVEIVVLEEEKRVLKIQGKSLPYVFVTIYIFSLPIVVVTKADSQGNWEYILDKSLVDGQHTVYVALNNNYGEIEEMSEPFVFVKIGDKVMRLFHPPETEAVSPIEILQKSFAVLVVGIIIFTLGLALVIIGIVLQRKEFPFSEKSK